MKEQRRLDEIDRLVHNHGALLIVDLVTSLGRIPVRVDDLGIDICYSGIQKYLSVLHGLDPITVSSKAMEMLTNRESKVPNWYLNLTIVKS
jgi:alanine-glyoxylate transaminase/serine-glyoxylate transaminase/serine-pyruvate transaminase